MRRSGFALFFLLMFPVSVPAQDLQNRSTLHLMGDFDEHWYLAVWPIANARTRSPSNFNIFAGAGYHTEKWYMEAMLQKQWNSKRGFWGLDLRYRRQATEKLSVYIEPAVYPADRAFYEFVILEYRARHKLNLGGETENKHQPGKDMLAAGPRVSYSVGKLWGTDFVIGAAYRLASPGRSEIRIYINTARRFALTGR